jgi:hypothetical protein
MVRACLVMVSLWAVSAAAASPPPAQPASSPAVISPPRVDVINGPGVLDEPRKVAEAYLAALAGNGSDSARNFLLGGVTLTAQDVTIGAWHIVKRDAARIEDKPIVDARTAMRALDKAGANSLNLITGPAEGEAMNLSQEQAAKLLQPTENASRALMTSFPVFAIAARVGKDVYWHPGNPWRKEVQKLGAAGNYHLELHRFVVEEQTSSGAPRTWGLRVLRVTSAGYDSGWKIVPAADWNPDY